MDDLILRRLEWLCERFTGLHLRVRQLDGEPRLFGPKGFEYDDETRTVGVRFKKKWSIAYCLEEVTPQIFSIAVEEKRIEILETSFGDPPPHKVDLTWSAAFLAEVMAVMGTEFEDEAMLEFLQQEKLFKPHGQAGALLIAAGAYGWRPFLEVDRGSLGVRRSVAEPEVRALMERVVGEMNAV